MTTDPNKDLYHDLGRFVAEKYRNQPDLSKACSNMRKQGFPWRLIARTLCDFGAYRYLKQQLGTFHAAQLMYSLGYPIEVTLEVLCKTS